MATYATLTVNAEDIIGADFDKHRASAWIEAGGDDGVLEAIKVDGTNLRVGGRRESPAADGTITFSNLVTTNSAANPTSFFYRVRIVYTPKGSRRQGHDEWTSAWFPLTGNANLANIDAAFDNLTAPITWRGDFLDQAQSLLAQQTAIAGLTGEDAAIANRVNTNGTATDTAIRARIATQARTNEGVLYLESYPRQGGETDDAPRFRRALADATALGAKVIQLGAGTFTFATESIVTVFNLTIRGAGKQATTIVVPSNFTALRVTGHYVSIEDLKMSCESTGRSTYPVRFENANHGAVRRCYFTAYDGARVAGVHFTGGSMGAVEDSTFNHCCIRIETWDVKVSRCYVWGMSCEFSIGIYNGAGNTTLSNVDIVPPLTSTAFGLAGIYVDGATGKPFNTKMSDIYLDGNPDLSTRAGIYLGDGVGATLMTNINANRMNSDCIVIDSAYNVLLDGYSGHTNNEGGNGSREIVVKQTGAQTVERIRLRGIQCLRTTAVTGTAGPAIEVESSVGGGAVAIDGFDIKQPTGGGGYSVPEVKVPVSGGYPTQSMSGTGMLSVYSAVGSQAFASGATSATINVGAPYPMAYRPRPSQIAFMAETTGVLVTRVQYTNDNQIFVAFSSAAGAAGTIHWRADLRR